MTILLKRQADPIANCEDEKGNTSLHYAAEKGWTSIAKKLMEHQGIPSITNKDGAMPVELAIHNNHNECASFLVKSMKPMKYVHTYINVYTIIKQEITVIMYAGL